MSRKQRKKKRVSREFLRNREKRARSDVSRKEGERRKRGSGGVGNLRGAEGRSVGEKISTSTLRGGQGAGEREMFGKSTARGRGTRGVRGEDTPRRTRKGKSWEIKPEKKATRSNLGKGVCPGRNLEEHFKA